MHKSILISILGQLNLKVKEGEPRYSVESASTDVGAAVNLLYGDKVFYTASTQCDEGHEGFAGLFDWEENLYIIAVGELLTKSIIEITKTSNRETDKSGILELFKMKRSELRQIIKKENLGIRIVKSRSNGDVASMIWAKRLQKSLKNRSDETIQD